MMKLIIAIICIMLLISCEQKIKFNKVLWTAEDEGEYDDGNRKLMIDDLIQNHKIKGLTYRQLIDSLGQPANWGEAKDSVGYPIITKWGGIDPIYSKTLIIRLNKDSIATSFKVAEWQKGSTY